MQKKLKMRLQEVKAGKTDVADFYFTGRDALNALYGSIESARSSVLLEFFIFEDDETGMRFARLLEAKARAGVTVMLSYDAIGSRGVSRKFLKELAASGVRISCFNPVFSAYGIIHANHRNHRKLAVIDKSISFIGGVNVADRYYDGGKYALWRDTFCKISGTDTAERLSVIFYNDFNHIYKSGGLVGEDWLMSKISGARSSVKILTPYFTPSKEMYKVLAAACMRGVEIDLMMPYRTDSNILHYCNMASVENCFCSFKYWRAKGTAESNKGKQNKGKRIRKNETGLCGRMGKDASRPAVRFRLFDRLIVMEKNFRSMHGSRHGSS